MTEKGSSNLNLIEIMSNLSNSVIDLQTKFNKLQIDFNQDNIKSLENKMKILKEKTNGFGFQTKTAQEISIVKQKIAELTFEVEQLSLSRFCFFKIANKWSKIKDELECCKYKCTNTNKPTGYCIEGNGFINLIDGENIKYINCLEGKGIDKRALVYSENRYKRPEYSINYSLFYFEIKCKIEKENFNEQILNVGFRSSSNLIKLDIINGAFVSYKEILLKECKITSFTWNNNDIFGCGLVYPPTNKTNKFPYVFFTQNGAQIGKSVLLKDLYCDYYEPYIILKCFSVETNFGNDLNLNPFIYDIKKHFLPKEFYVDTDEEDSDFVVKDMSLMKRRITGLNILAEFFPKIEKKVIKQVFISKHFDKYASIEALNKIQKENYSKND
ncbi:hypothetical protein ACQ4LE_008971 [Meloidogyne hapla]